MNISSLESLLLLEQTPFNGYIAAHSSDRCIGYLSSQAEPSRLMLVRTREFHRAIARDIGRTLNAHGGHGASKPGCSARNQTRMAWIQSYLIRKKTSKTCRVPHLHWLRGINEGIFSTVPYIIRLSIRLLRLLYLSATLCSPHHRLKHLHLSLKRLTRQI